MDPRRLYEVPIYRIALVRDEGVRTASPVEMREPGHVARLLAPKLVDLDREVFWVAMLDGRNRVIGLHHVSTGSLTSTLVHPREVFKAAMLANAAAVILVHNHPSGDPAPSGEDLALTKRLQDVGELVGIRVLDHVILGASGTFRSLAGAT